MKIIDQSEGTVVKHHYESVNMVLVDDSVDCKSDNFEEIINFWENLDIREAA